MHKIVHPNPATIPKYFPGSRPDDIKRPLTPAKFQQLFGALSPSQLEIIKDRDNRYIVVAAGPGSGKTRVLVLKLEQNEEMRVLLVADDDQNIYEFR